MLRMAQIVPNWAILICAISCGAFRRAKPRIFAGGLICSICCAVTKTSQIHTAPMGVLWHRIGARMTRLFKGSKSDD